MHAAVVTSFDVPPTYQEHPVPEPAGPNEELVQVLAAGLHPRVRSQASGSHYTSTDELPLVPGVDGVGRDADGRLRYFFLSDTTMGSMAERTVIDRRRSVVLPDGSDPVAVAAAMNPAMSAWMALRYRSPFVPGQDILVLGATGNAGRMAVQVARHLGADRVVAAGRDRVRLGRLAELGATNTVGLGDVAGSPAGDLGDVAADVDVVVDYLWGEPAASAMVNVLTNRSDRGRPLTWVQVGAVAGPTSPVPSAALRAARFQIVGSGQGSIELDEYLTEFPAIAGTITAGAFQVDARAVPLADVERAWQTTADRGGERIVLVP